MFLRYLHDHGVVGQGHLALDACQLGNASVELAHERLAASELVVLNQGRREVVRNLRVAVDGFANSQR